MTLVTRKFRSETKFWPTKKLEKTISDDRVASYELKREFEEKAIAVVESKKEKCKT